MDPVANPYSPGAGLRPRELAGRDSELGAFGILVQRAEAQLTSRSIVLSGLRGVGKTVLLNEMAATATTAGWVVGKVEADLSEGRRTFREQVAGTLNRALRETTRSWDVAGKIRRALGTFKAFSLHTDPSGGLSVGFEIDPEQGRGDSGSLDVDLTDLALDLGVAAASRNVGVALFVDELQHLSKAELAAVCQSCHEAGQRTVPFYVIGAGLPSLPGLLAEAKSYAERLFDYWSIGALNPVAAADALAVPALAAGVHWDKEAVDLLVASAGGYPYFLQEFGKAAWDYSGGPAISLDDATAAIRIGTDNLDRGFFISRWNRATPSERAYMRAMAADGDQPSQSGDVAKRVGKRATSVGPTRAALIHKGLVYSPEHGYIAFTVPGMASFVNRQMQP